jgi:glycosyltransferase involved in cell wall biosynthesis
MPSIAQPTPNRVVIVTIADLPEGGGNTSRLKSLAALVRSAGFAVEIWNEHALGIAPPGLLQAEGTLGVVPFRFVLGRTARRYGFAAAGDKLRAVIRIVRAIVGARHSLRGVWLNCLSFYDALPINLVCRILRIPCVQSHEDERFEVIHAAEMSFARKLFAFNSWLGDRLVVRLASALVVISSYLRDKYARFTRRPIFIIPTLIDFEEWPELPSPPALAPRRFVYTGALGKQDAMEEVLAAFVGLHREGKSFTFDVYGDSQRGLERKHELIALANQLGLAGRVNFCGYQSRERMLAEIRGADVLVGIRRANQWAVSGLSTKVSEYLASGRPTVVSSIGDGQGYLRDGENCLLVKDPNQPEEFDRVLRQALEAPPEWLAAIGRQGRQLAREQFAIEAHLSTVAAIFNCVQKP